VSKFYAVEREWRRIQAALNKEGDAWKAQWFRTVVDAAKPKSASIYVYGEIGWEVTSSSFAQALDELGDVEQIDLHINSPGGSVFEGLAVYNMLKRFPATIAGTVDGFAASAASFIAMACDTLVMGTGTQMMIHDASGLCIGREEDMHAMGDVLGTTSDEIAGFYARRAGGTVTSWRDAMRAETWYTGEEAVAAGLADSVAEPTDDADTKANASKWDLSMFRYAGRDAAPAPTLHVPSEQLPSEAPAMPAVGVAAVPVIPQVDPQPVDDVESSIFAELVADLEAADRSPWGHLVPSDSTSPDVG